LQNPITHTKRHRAIFEKTFFPELQKFISLLSIAPWGNPAYDGLVEKMSVRQPEAQQEKFKKDGWFYATQSIYGTK
jgi:hypothetical protein